MNVEIEHKYLLKNTLYRDMAYKTTHIIQGYLSRDKQRTVRVRVKDDKACLTVKTCNKGDTRDEFEYIIPLSDAKALLKSCIPPIIEKTRFLVNFDGFVWEIDEFTGELNGVAIAEIELPSSDTHYTLPPFAGKNVTGNPLYYNSNIHLLAGGKSTQLQ